MYLLFQAISANCHSTTFHEDFIWITAEDTIKIFEALKKEIGQNLEHGKLVRGGGIPTKSKVLGCVLHHVIFWRRKNGPEVWEHFALNLKDITKWKGWKLETLYQITFTEYHHSGYNWSENCRTVSTIWASFCLLAVLLSGTRQHACRIIQNHFNYDSFVIL